MSDKLSKYCRIPKRVTEIRREDRGYKITFKATVDRRRSAETHTLTFYRKIDHLFNVSIEIWLDNLHYHSEKVTEDNWEEAVFFWNALGDEQHTFRNKEIEKIRAFGKKFYRRN